VIWPSPLVVAPPPLFVVGCRVVSVVPPCRRAPAGSVLLPVRPSAAYGASRCSDRGVVAGRCPPLVDSRFPSLVELSPPGRSRWWCRGSPLEWYRSTGGPTSSSEPGSSLVRRRSSESSSPATSQSLLSRFVVDTGRGSSVVLCWWSVLACRRSLFIASSLPSSAPLSEGSIHYHISDSRRLVRLPSPPLSPACFLAPARIVRYATIH